MSRLILITMKKNRSEWLHEKTMHVLNIYPSLRAQTSPSRAEISDQVRYDEGRTLHYPINGRGNKTTDVLTIKKNNIPTSESPRSTRGRKDVINYWNKIIYIHKI
jgi:hypothetical protein